jgi:ribonuclease-3
LNKEKQAQINAHRKLSKQLGYQFKQPALLMQALTHRSAKGVHNERLEFLGDAILNFVIAQILYEMFPDSSEGELTRMRSSLVKGVTLSEIARSFNLGDYLILGPGELKSGGFKRDSILEDAIEAIIGAIYIDADIHIVQRVVLSWFAPRLAKIEPGQAQKDPKSLLQEYLQGRKIALPNYEVIQITGQSHQQEFTVRCSAEKLDVEVITKGASRRKAEQEAAQQLLEKIKNAN